METAVYRRGAAEQAAWWDTNTTAEAHGGARAAERSVLIRELANLCVQQGVAFHEGSIQKICVLSSEISRTIFAITQNPEEQAELFHLANQLTELANRRFG